MFALTSKDADLCEKSCVVISLPFDLEDNIEKKIQDAVSEDFLVGGVNYSSDIAFEEKEFFYLIGFQVGDKIGAKELKKAVSCLIKKNKFQKITLMICPAKQGKLLRFGLTGFWTFRKMKVHGLLVGRQEYSKYYLIEPGDPFDLEKHEHSLNKMQNLLKEQGYFQGELVSELVRDKSAKSIDVQIMLNRGAKFSIGDVKFIVKSPAGKKGSELACISKRVHQLFVSKFAGKSYSKALINRETRALKRYLSKKGFLHVDIELVERIRYQKKEVSLKIVLTLHSKKEFVFFGNSFFSTSQLLDKILVFGRSAWLVPTSILSGEIIQEYHKYGFWEVSVKAKEEKGGCFFLINEGARACVKEIELLGVNSFETTVLEQKVFCEFLRAKYFEEEKLHRALELLASFYLKHGFWNIKILKHEFKKIDGKNSYKLVLSIDKGVRSFLRSVSIQGCEGAKELLLQGPFSKFAFNGEQAVLPFDINVLTGQKSWLLKYFKQKGYLHVDVIYKLKKNRENNKEGNKEHVDLVWIVTPGKKVIFGKTVVQGSRTFPSDYIMRELQYKEGDVWDNEKLKKSIERLRSLDIFEHAHLYPYRVAVPELQKDVLLRLQHADPYEIRTRIGLARYGISKENIFGCGFTYKLGGAFLWKNPFKVADTFLFDFDAALDYRNICAQYTRPWIFGYPVKTIFKIYANRYEQPGFVCSRKHLYQAEQDGFLVGCNRVYPHVDISLNVGLEWAKTSIKTNMARLAALVSHAIDFDPCLLGKRIPYLLLEPTVLVDKVDDKLNPRSGYFTLVSFKGMFPLRQRYINSFFIKLMAEQSVFYSFNSRIIGALRLRFGHVFNQCFRAIMPIERFYLGGAHSIRGYEKDMCPPWGIFCDKNRDFEVDAKAITKSRNIFIVAPQGGRTMFSVNLEARINLYSSISGVIFQDAGALVGDCFNNAISSAATGIGLRFNTAIGPIRFDIGWKWKVRRKFESRCAWFLAFGNAF